MVTCLAVGVYTDALTRGRRYEVLAERGDGSVRLRGDNGRVRWFPGDLFDHAGGDAPTLVRWWFVDDHRVPAGGDGWEEVGFELSDGSKRWCSVATPGHLAELLAEPLNAGIWAPTMVVVRRLEREVVEAVLRHLDRQGELLEASRPIER